MSEAVDQSIIIPLENVESEHGALIIDKALAKIKNISTHKVELNNQRAVIHSSQANEALASAIQSIRDLGYGVTTVKKNLPVLNMSCASCASSAQTILKSQIGVVQGDVNYANGTAQLEYVPTVTSPRLLKSALQSIGYDLMIDESEEAKDHLDELQHEKFLSLKRKTIGAIALSLPVMIIGMFFMDMPYGNYILWALTTPVVFVFGKQFFVSAWKQTKHGSANMDTLVALSTGVAYFFSVFNTVYPEYWHSRGLHAHVYFEASAVVIAFILLGKWLEERAKNKTSSAIKKLMGLKPKTVTVVRGGKRTEEIAIAAVNIGDILLVKPGEKIAVDGTVVTGTSFVDESMISGEPIPVEKKTGEKVYAGTINQKGSFEFSADKVGGQTVLAQIIALVQQAQGSKPPVQKLVDKIAGIFVPVVIGIAIITLLVWVIIGGENSFTHGLLAMVTVLVIACPCALGLATPTAIMAGVGKGAEHGILIKDAESLELAKKINVVVFDKTGTITEGKPAVVDIRWENEESKDASALASLEKLSEHPLAEAILKHLGQSDYAPVENFRSITGQGVEGKVAGKKYFVGNRSLLISNQVSIPELLETTTSQWIQQANTVIWFADDRSALAAVAIRDNVKKTSVEAIKKLQAEGIEVYMLTGDNQTTAHVIAEAVGIKKFKAEAMPADKVSLIKDLQREGKTVAMVGDGINDSGALAQADVSIAMGKGSDIAMDVAKMTIISSDLSKVHQAIRLSKMTIATIHQNLFWAFIYNVIGIPIAAGILYPINGFLLNPMIAGAAMAFSSVSVVSNSLRLRNRTIH